MKNLSRPLEGIRVVELGTHFAIPCVGRIMADWGAESIKVEAPQGDQWRIVGRNQKCPIDDDENPFFTVPNANKKFIAIDLKNQEGKDTLMKLIGTADVFLSNMRMPALKKLGFDYNSVSALYPKIVYAHFTGYGYEGPDSEKPGFDSVAFWARSGAMIDWAPKGSAPFLPPTGAGDAMVGSILCAGVLAALIGQRATGKGTFLSSSLMGSSIWYNNAAVVSTQYGNEFPKDKDRPANPFGWQYECADGEWLMIGVVDYNGSYNKLMKLLGREDLVDDERYNTISAVQQNITEFMSIMRECFKQKNRDEWVDLITELNIVVGKIGHLSELATDPQAIANNFVQDVKFPSGKTVAMPTVPLMFSNYDVGEEYTPSGAIGCDTEEILSSIGYSTEEIAKLKVSGAVK